MAKPKKKQERWTKKVGNLLIGNLKNRVSNSKFNEGGKKDFLGVNRNKELEKLMKQMN